MADVTQQHNSKGCASRSSNGSRSSGFRVPWICKAKVDRDERLDSTDI